MISDLQFQEFGFGHPLIFPDIKTLINIILYILNIMIKMQQLTSWDILTSNPSPWREIISDKSFTMV